MDNPFLIDGSLQTNASINKLIIAEMPSGAFDDDFTGKAALDLFSTKLFIEEIKKYNEELNINLDTIEEKMLPQYLNECLDNADNTIYKTANMIVKKFGERLGIILLTLKQGKRANRDARKDWTDDNWDYWSSLDNVVLCGGLASSKIGEKLKFYIEEVFKKSNEKCYNIILSKDSSNVGIKGCATYIKNKDFKKYYLILDLGQTFIKRSLVKVNDKEKYDILKLNKILSKHVEWEFENINQEKYEAKMLHEYILEIITNTIRECENESRDIGKMIVISIANYVNNGSLVNRGGYGKLRLLENNYEEYLSKELYKKVNALYKIKLVHDGTAMAQCFSNYKNTVCISLGTAFGVGFTMPAL